MQTESKLLVFEKVPTKGFKLDAIGTHIRRAQIPGDGLSSSETLGASHSSPTRSMNGTAGQFEICYSLSRGWFVPEWVMRQKKRTGEQT